MQAMFENSTANENTAARSYSVRTLSKKVLMVQGTFDGATVKLQISFDGGTTWVDVGTDAEFTAAGVATIDYHGGLLRWNIAGGSESTQDISAYISDA